MSVTIKAVHGLAKFLPSKSFLAVTSAVVFSVAFVFSAYELKNRKVTQNQLLIPVISTEEGRGLVSVGGAVTEKDNDEDGLKNWEEALWQTSPNNKDSDGDKTLDGEEVKKGRDPLKSGPNDKLTLPTETKLVGGAEGNKITPTDVVARDLFAKYLTTKQSGGALDPKVQEGLIASVLSIQKQASKTARVYTEGELEVSKDATPVTLKKYGNVMGTIIKNNLKQDEIETDILSRAIEKNDKKELAKLDPIIKNYRNILEESLKISVPEKAAQTHLKFINSISNVLFSLESMRLVFDDPITAMTSLGSYSKTMTELAGAYVDAERFFARNNISFDPQKEPGNYFAKMATLIKEFQTILAKNS